MKFFTFVPVATMLLVASLCPFAQTTPPEWSVDFGNLISQAIFLKQSDAGILVVNIPTKLIGNNPATKAKAWETSEVKNIQESEFKLIDGTHFIMVEFQKES